jgi:hypothetical protein
MCAAGPWRSVRWVRTLLLLVASACGGSDATPIEWVVTSHRGMGRRYSDITDKQADSLVGLTIRLGTPAFSLDETCERPTYVERRVMAAPFMATEYELSTGSINVDGRDSIDVIDVMCQGSPWSTLGGKVIFTSDALGYAPWENRLFIIRPKDPE